LDEIENDKLVSISKKWGLSKAESIRRVIWEFKGGK
jgi:hypothetical protein